MKIRLETLSGHFRLAECFLFRERLTSFTERAPLDRSQQRVPLGMVAFEDESPDRVYRGEEATKSFRPYQC